MKEPIKDYKQIIEKRYKHKPIEQITIKPWRSMKSNLYITFFKDGDYVAFSDHCGCISAQMRKGRWYNARTKMPLKIDW